MTHTKGYFLTGFEGVQSGMGILDILKLILGNPYTIPAAIIAGTFGNMASFGTDQDMVQRMLTATDYKKSRRSLITAALLDLPIFFFFSLIGVLLIAFYDLNPSLRPAKPNDVFGAYILNVMPVVVRGFVLAGVFATAMGSLSAALNALATSLTNDWYIPYFGKGKGQKHYVAAARVFTAVFAVLMIAIASTFAFANVRMPTLTIIPVALGIAGYILGPMLGVFLTGMLTKTRGSDHGNMWAVSMGLFTIFLLSGRLTDLVNWILPGDYSVEFPWWLPKVQFTWYVMIGSLATFAVGLLYRTPNEVVDGARKRAEAAGHAS
jgi:Na+/proline symporter